MWEKGRPEFICNVYIAYTDYGAMKLKTALLLILLIQTLSACSTKPTEPECEITDTQKLEAENAQLTTQIKDLQQALGTKEDELKTVQDELDTKIKILDQVKRDLKLKSEREEEFVEKYTEMRGKLEQCEATS